tara:strand:+ start:394 stop:552 length:159 start_codon:yes stop_codon:yes gene_type:complete
MTEKRKTCAHCGDIFKGCACRIRKAKDGKPVHTTCLSQYNYILELKEKENGK